MAGEGLHLRADTLKARSGDRGQGVLGRLAARAFRRKRIKPVIPSRADQPENPDFDRKTYRQRNAVARLVGKLKQFRRVATRYDKRKLHYLAFVHLASVIVWLWSFGDTT
jgi:transposase